VNPPNSLQIRPTSLRLQSASAQPSQITLNIMQCVPRAVTQIVTWMMTAPSYMMSATNSIGHLWTLALQFQRTAARESCTGGRITCSVGQNGRNSSSIPHSSQLVGGVQRKRFHVQIKAPASLGTVILQGWIQAPDRIQYASEIRNPLEAKTL
jgi:hypothetical protein